jgi:hypothetical protein
VGTLMDYCLVLMLWTILKILKKMDKKPKNILWRIVKFIFAKVLGVVELKTQKYNINKLFKWLCGDSDGLFFGPCLWTILKILKKMDKKPKNILWRIVKFIFAKVLGVVELKTWKYNINKLFKWLCVDSDGLLFGPCAVNNF